MSKDMFSFSGRIGRGIFLLVAIPLVIINIGLPIFMKIMIGKEGVDLGALLSFLIIWGTISTWIAIANYTKRWHDLNKSGWMNLTLLIPIVNIIIFVYLAIAPGIPEPNRYDDDAMDSSLLDSVKREQPYTKMAEINRALGLFIFFFGVIVLISMLFTKTLIGKMTNLGAGSIIAAIGIGMIVRSKTKSSDS